MGHEQSQESPKTGSGRLACRKGMLQLSEDYKVPWAFAFEDKMRLFHEVQVPVNVYKESFGQRIGKLNFAPMLCLLCSPASDIRLRSHFSSRDRAISQDKVRATAEASRALLKAILDACTLHPKLPRYTVLGGPH